MKNLFRGLTAGTWGVIAMAGTSLLIRRLVQPQAIIGKTHYEKVVEKAVEVVSPETTLDVDTRVRIGEFAHLGAGAFWGAVMALLYRGGINPLRQGLTNGTAIWLGAFAGYMPALGISRSILKMDNYERFRTWICHVVYAGATLHALRGNRS